MPSSPFIQPAAASNDSASSLRPSSYPAELPPFEIFCKSLCRFPTPLSASSIIFSAVYPYRQRFSDSLIRRHVISYNDFVSIFVSHLFFLRQQEDLSDAHPWFQGFQHAFRQLLHLCNSALPWPDRVPRILQQKQPYRFPC